MGNQITREQLISETIQKCKDKAYYKQLRSSGMFFELFPEFTGNWDEDIKPYLVQELITEVCKIKFSIDQIKDLVAMGDSPTDWDVRLVRSWVDGVTPGQSFEKVNERADSVLRLVKFIRIPNKTDDDTLYFNSNSVKF